MATQVHEIEGWLGGPSKDAEFLARYIGARMPGQRAADEQSRLTYWGLKVPIHRNAAKAKFSFSHLEDEEQWRYWTAIWRSSDIFDVKSVALCWLGDRRRRGLRLKKWKDIIRMAQDIDNWAHSDALSSMLAEILEEKPELFKIYEKWNRSRNPWLRRQSIVGIYCYARSRKSKWPAASALVMVERLLDDPHFYVQRGVGWTLREIDRVDSVKQREFVRQHLRRISATAWFAASELYPVKMRKELVKRRRV